MLIEQINIELLIYFLISVGALLICFKSVLKHKKRVTYIKNFPEYMSVLEYYMEKAFDIIYREQIMVYSLEAMHLNDKEVDKASKSFVHLTMKMLGPSLLDEITEMFGSEETLTFNILEYFNRRYDNDEIRRTSLDELSAEEE